MSVQSPLVVLSNIKYEKEAAIFMASQKSQKMRIILKAYDHQLIDFAASKDRKSVVWERVFITV